MWYDVIIFGFQRPKRASLISTLLMNVLEFYLIMFQRPKRASLISTKKVKRKWIWKPSSFNALNGLLSFLQYVTSFMFRPANMFQRPKRASLISTVPSENPHKHGLSGLVFAGICLKILITGIFHSFSGMCTICSYFKTFPTAEIILQFSFD